MKKNLSEQVKRWIGLFMILAMLMTAVPVMSFAQSMKYGDLDGDTKITATDALEALKSVVGKVTLSDQQKIAGDVNVSSKVDAADALMILQFVVGKISIFPAQEMSSMSDEEVFYYKLDQQYNVNYAEFENEIVQLDDSEDAAAIVEALGGAPESANVEEWGVNADQRLSYTPLSNEAKRLGKLSKYNNIPVTKGEIKVGGTTVTYTVPKNATAYDAVPITYTVKSTTKNLPVNFEATAFEDVTRYKKASDIYADCNLPGIVKVDLSYEGYVSTTTKVSPPLLSKDPNQDIQGTRYPAFDTTELSKSGTIKAGAEYTWFKFKFTNTGNTILDGEGNSTFRFMPVLQKKSGSTYTDLGGTPNNYYPLLDYVYPGESGEFWCLCYTGPNKFDLSAGDYRIVIYGCLRNEQDNFDFTTMQVAGKTVTTATFDFKVTETGGMTTPNAVQNSTTAANGQFKRNNWLGDFEEFLSSYSGILNAENRTGTMYVQVAPWTDSIVLKVLNGNSNEFNGIRVPINVESDSISLTLNPYNTNYVVKEDGTRTPMVMTQNMADMRGHVDRGPYCDVTILNELRNMKEAGVNTITTTHAYTGDYTGLYDMSMFMLDCARAMNFTLEGHALYYYRGQNAVSRVRASDGKISLGSGRDMFNMQNQDAANGVLARWNLIRYGEFYYYNPVTKEIPISIEENYGWMTYNLNNRYGIDNTYSDRLLYKWLQQAYDDDIDLLNEKYGSDYNDFKNIKVSDQSYSDGVASVLNGEVYGENWNAANVELDLFRTSERTRYYKEFLKFVDVEGAKVYLRSENGIFLAPGIKPTTDNAHYRQIYYEQRKSASVPEVLAASGIIYGDSSYSFLPLADSEVYELTRQASKAGFVTAKTPSFNHLTDIVVNPYVGTFDVSEKYNTKDYQKSCAIGRSASLFTWCKAIYEAGGVPGTMWMDYACDLYVTTTQYKELQFFNQKIEEMLSTEEGKEWAMNIPAEELTDPLADVAVQDAYSFKPDYIKNAIATLPRKNIIMGFCE